MSLHLPPVAELSRDDVAPGILGWAERGLLPDSLLRLGIRRMCAQRLEAERAGGPAVEAGRFQQRLTQLRAEEVALHTDAANIQHYELPPEFFVHCLGRRLKYSSAYYPTGRESLDEAENAMLALYGQRAELADGQEILELGCGWGSLTLWMAERYPNARICAVSNSKLQTRAYRGVLSGAPPRQRADRDDGRQPSRAARRAVRSLCLHRDVRAHAQL